MRIGFLQLRLKFGAVKINVRKTKSLLDKVSDATIVLPELFNTGYLFRNEEELASLAERVPSGYTTSELKKVAKRRRLNLVFGIAQKFKGVSSRILRKEFPELKQKVGKHLWAPSNYHGSVGQGFEVVENYVKHQKERHKD